MSKNLDKMLLAEAFDAIVNDNDVAKATRLFKRHWDLAAKNSYAILEAADKDFEINDLGDDFNNEMADEIGSDSEEKFNQIQIAIDELEDKFPTEMTDDIRTKFDDLRNIVDEMKLAEGDEDEDLAEDASVALEDIRGEFDMAGEIDDEVSDLFDEISSGIQGEYADSTDETDVADDDMVNESAEDDVDLEYTDDKDELESEDIEDVKDDEAEDGKREDKTYDEVQRGEDDVMDDIKYSADELVALIDELEGIEGDEKEAVDESWSKIPEPRKKMTSEDEGVNKKGTMNFGKLAGVKLDRKAGLASAGNSAGKTPSTKVKVNSNENKGAKAWHKIEKPTNKAAGSKSMMGK
jgi:hypothetical protein